jgi:hypothetical protein
MRACVCSVLSVRPAMFSGALALLLAVQHGAAIADDRRVEIDPPVNLSTAVARQLTIEFPSGDMVVSPSDDDQLHAQVLFFCKEGSDRCRDNASAARIVHTQDGEQSTLRFEPKSAYNTKFVQMEFLVQVPAVETLDVEMKAGALAIDSPTGCLTVRAGVGDVSVRAPRSAVASVDLDTGMGDASLLGPRNNTRESRPMLVGSEVSWDDGDGRCDLTVTLKVGQIGVTLD